MMQNLAFSFLCGHNSNISKIQSTKKKIEKENKTPLIGHNKNILQKKENFERRTVITFLNFSFLLGYWVSYPKCINSKTLENLSGKPFLTKTGLRILDFSVGEGGTPEWGNLIAINYVLYVSNSNNLEKIDSTYERNSPFLFQHGGGQIILGLEEAVHEMRKGGKRRIVLPTYLGYSNPGLGPVPPNPVARKKLFNKAEEDTVDPKRSIVLDIEVLSIQKPKEGLDWYKANPLNSNKIQKILGS